MAAQPGPRQSFPQSNYMPNGAPGGGPPTGPTGVPAPGARPLDPNQGRVIQQNGSRVLCIADVRGDLNSVNSLAKQARADYVIHTGDFGFYDERSLERISDKTLKHVIQYSPLLADETRRQIAALPQGASIKSSIPSTQLPLSQLPQFLNGQFKFDVPVYAVWGACEDVQVLEKLRAQEYKIDKLNILDEGHSRLLEIGGVKLRLLGLGGALVMHKLFDNGEGRTTIAGGQGTMWITLLQMGELIDTANRTYDPTETRLFVTHSSPSREGMLNQLAVSLKADFSISGGLHFRYGSSYNEFSVNPSLDHFRGKLAASKASFQDVWETVKLEVEPIVAENEPHQRLLNNALEVIGRMPAVANGGNPFGGAPVGAIGQVDEAAFKNMWNFNLADAAYGWLALDVEGGRIGTEMKALGFNFAHRGKQTPQQMTETIKATTNQPSVPTPGAVAPPPYSQNAQQQTPLPSGPTPGQQPMQTRPGQQLRQQSSQQQNQQRQTSSTGPQQSQAQPPKSQTPSGRPSSQAPANQTAASGPTTNGTPATTDSKPNGVTSPAVGEAASTSTPPPTETKEQSLGIFLSNGPKTEDEARKLFSEADQAKITTVRLTNSAKSSWYIGFATHEEMQGVLDSMPQEMKGPMRYGKLNVRPFVRIPRPGQAGYKSGSDTEGGRGGRGGMSGRGRGRGGTERGARGTGRGGRGGQGKDGQSGASPTPASAPAPAASGSS